MACLRAPRGDYRLAPRDELPFGNVIVIDGDDLWAVEAERGEGQTVDRRALVAHEAPKHERVARISAEAAERYAAFDGLPLAA